MAKLDLFEIDEKFGRWIEGRFKEFKMPNEDKLNKFNKKELVRILYWIVYQDCVCSNLKERKEGEEEVYCESYYPSDVEGLQLLEKVGLFRITEKENGKVKGVLKTF